jgi:hypothetical protein
VKHYTESGTVLGRDQTGASRDEAPLRVWRISDVFEQFLEGHIAFKDQVTGNADRSLAAVGMRAHEIILPSVFV